MMELTKNVGKELEDSVTKEGDKIIKCDEKPEMEEGETGDDSDEVTSKGAHIEKDQGRIAYEESEKTIILSGPLVEGEPGPWAGLSPEVAELLAAVRALCTAGNTDMVLLCGAWQMRCHASVLRARSPTLAAALAGRPVARLRLEAEPGALGAVVGFMYTGRLEALGPNTALAEVVAVGARLQVAGLLRSCLPLLQVAGPAVAAEVLLVAEPLGLEPLVAAAVERVTVGRGQLLRDPGLRERLLGRPPVLLRLFEAVSREGPGLLRACYGCGASSTGLYCAWCDRRPAG
jgi:hypothetical protein